MEFWVTTVSLSDGRTFGLSLGTRLYDAGFTVAVALVALKYSYHSVSRPRL